MGDTSFKFGANYLSILLFITDGAAIDLEDLDGRSPLHWAALGGHAPICLALVEQGLAADSRDKMK